MATPYVTDETGGECGDRGAASPGILGLGVRTWKRVCATPIPGLLLCHAPVPPSPFIPFGLLPAPPSGLVFFGGGLCFRSPKPWGPPMSPAPGPLGASALSSCWSPVPLQGSPALWAPVLSSLQFQPPFSLPHFLLLYLLSTLPCFHSFSPGCVC